MFLLQIELVLFGRLCLDFKRKTILIFIIITICIYQLNIVCNDNVFLKRSFESYHKIQ